VFRQCPIFFCAILAAGCLVSLDDVALVSWLGAEQTEVLEQKTPHNLDYIRVAGSLDSVEVTLRRWVRH